jgi:hypothetical protein
MGKKRLLKWFGYCSTTAIFACAILPGTFGIPVPWRPWLFLGSILWLFLFSIGFFNA